MIKHGKTMKKCVKRENKGGRERFEVYVVTLSRSLEERRKESG